MSEHLPEKINPYGVVTNQTGVHPSLIKVITKHKQTSYLKPISERSLRSFIPYKAVINANPKQTIIVDSGCGEGHSSLVLANKNPSCLVIGIDKSVYRLNKVKKRPDNCIIMNGNCIDVWRLLLPYRDRIGKHYILYPNPWPKKKHLKRRWHGHPILPTCIQLSDRLIMRSNWQQYLIEFAIAAESYGYRSKLTTYHKSSGMTKFEVKYWLAGCKTYQLELTKIM